MRVIFFRPGDQAGRDQAGRFRLPVMLLMCSMAFVSGCSRSAEELLVVPPATHPLIREYIGYGVVNVSFTHLLSEPGSAGASIGYFRRGTVVRIIERRSVNAKSSADSWVLAEGNYEGGGTVSRGWIEEATLEIYNSEAMAKTASKAMSL